MSGVNPEFNKLDRNDRGSLKLAVTELFGTSNGAVVRAVGNWLARPHGSFDAANLRVVAAAAPLLDENHVVTIVESLPITAWHLPVAPFELEPVRAYLATVLASVDKAGRARLVKSLVEETTYRTIELSSQRPVSVTGFVQSYIDRVIRHGRPVEVSRAINSGLSSAQQLRTAFEKRGHQYEVAKGLAKCRWADDEILRPLAGRSKELKFIVSGNPAATPNLLRELGPTDLKELWATNVQPLVANPAADASLLRDVFALAIQDPTKRGAELLGKLATNPSSPSDLLTDLADYAVQEQSGMDTFKIASALTENPNTPTPALDRLFLLPMMSHGLMPGKVLMNPNLSMSALLECLPGADVVSKRRVVSRVDLTPVVLDALAKDGDFEVAYGVVVHPNTAKSTLKSLRRDGDWFLSTCARARLRAVSSIPGLPAIEMPELPPITHSQRQLQWMAESLAENSVAPGTLGILVAEDRLEVSEINAALMHMDIEAALEFVVSRPLPDGAGVEHLAVQNVRQVAQAIEGGAGVKASKELRGWSDLPASSPLDFKIRSAANSLDGLTVAGLTGHLIRETQMLLDVKDKMGNCLDTYTDRARRGEVAIVVFDDPVRANTYAAAYNVIGQSLSLLELNSENNRSEVPSEFRSALDAAIAEIDHAPKVTCSELTV